jgi:hypothetical protein
VSIDPPEDDPERSREPETIRKEPAEAIPETAVEEAKRSPSSEGGDRGDLGKSEPNLGSFPSEEISPTPTQVLRLPRERAYMLATLPRSKLGELFWPALTGIAGAGPGAGAALHEGYFTNATSAGLSLFGLIEVAGLVVFVTLLGASIFTSLRVQTSLKFLNQLYPPASKIISESRRLRMAKWILRC